ncbi:MAG: hypothetical protein ACWGQW_07535 [bacterium]
MAAYQHKDIPNAYLHEPKGIAKADSGDVYIADGGGSGDWAPLSTLVTDEEIKEYIYLTFPSGTATTRFLTFNRDVQIEKSRVGFLGTISADSTFDFTIYTTTGGLVSLGTLELDSSIVVAGTSYAITFDETDRVLPGSTDSAAYFQVDWNKEGTYSAADDLVIVTTVIHDTDSPNWS